MIVICLFEVSLFCRLAATFYIDFQFILTLVNLYHKNDLMIHSLLFKSD